MGYIRHELSTLNVVLPKKEWSYFIPAPRPPRPPRPPRVLSPREVRCVTTLTAIDPLRENFRKYATFFLFLPELLVSVNENT